jgi:hypothetical protein
MYIFVENYFYVLINNSHFFYSCSVPYPEDFGKILNEFEYKAVNVFNLILHMFPKLLAINLQFRCLCHSGLVFRFIPK